MKTRIVAMVGILCMLASGPAAAAIVIDVDGDGVDVAGSVTTSLMSDKATKLRWTKAGTDDAFLVLDTAALSRLGTLHDRQGNALEGTVLVRGGLEFRGANGKSKTFTSAWQLLRALDGNGDGVVDAADPAWKALRLFTDANGDGRMDIAHEVRPIDDGSLRSIQFKGLGDSMADEFGNTRVDGTFTRTDGSTGTAADVTFSSGG